MLHIRDALRELMDFQLHGDPELGWELPTMEYEKRLKELLDRLNREYDSYIKKNMGISICRGMSWHFPRMQILRFYVPLRKK